MKHSKLMLLLAALVLGSGLQLFAQDTLPEITVKAVRYKYLDAVDQKDVAQPVKLLQRYAAEYNVKTANFYEDDYDTYFVSFYIPEGKILAAYDKNGKLLRTAEKYSNIVVPEAVKTALNEKYPKWTIAKDVYLVNYHDETGATKVYQLTLQNGDKRNKVKVNDKGEFL